MTPWTSEELWGLLIAAGKIVTAIGMIVMLRRRPNAPPNSPMIRWTVAWLLFSGAALIGFLFWLGGRRG